MVGRTKKSANNVKVMIISKVINLFLSFISRTFFINYLGSEYLGVNGLFTNILTILSFAELGIGNAIIFKLYKPVAENNKEQIKTLMHFYKKIYIIIGCVVLGIGLCITPFINVLVNNNVEIKESIYILFLLFLLNTTVSYFCTYKRSIIIANQDEYITSIIELVINVLANLTKILLLILTKNYILYLVSTVLFTIVGNIIISIAANKKYQYITEKEYNEISKKEKRNIFNDVKSIILYKIGFVLSNGTDNIIISKALGVGQVGMLSNYTLITTSINTLISSAFNSLTGSIGNLNTINDRNKKEKVFYELLLLSFIIYGTISSCLILLLNKFIHIWIGDTYVLSMLVPFALGLNFYIDGMRFVNYTFRNTLGLFKKGRYAPLISSITNVILSIVLVRIWGIFGVLIATAITRLFILTLYDPYIIHKYEFKTSSIKFIKKYSIYMLIFFISTCICFYINKFIKIDGIIGFVVCGTIDVIINLLITLITTIKTEEFKSLKNRIINKEE